MFHYGIDRSNNINNIFYATSLGESCFPDIQRVKEGEYQENSIDFRVNQWVIASKIFLGLASISIAGAAIVFTLGLATPLVICTAAIAASVFGGGSLGILAGSGNLSSFFIKSEDVFIVRWRENKAKKTETLSNPEVVLGFPTKNGKEGFKWKKELIKSANDRIVLSGNYCGGQSFDEILDLFHASLEKKGNLKVVLLSSPKFFTNENKERLKELHSKYSQRFQLVETPDKWMDSDHLKKITNHTKGLVVDGAKFIMGGSGIEDKYAYYEGVGDKQQEESNNTQSSMLDHILPRGFRDMDFVFEGHELGGQLERELLKLARIWENYNAGNNVNPPDLDASVVGKMLGGDKTQIVKKKSTEEFDRIKIEAAEENGNKKKNTSSGSFHISAGICEIISSGPEMRESPYGKRLIEEVRKAKESIFIDHMYFHPTEELKNLLIEKINNGVQLTVVTNGSQSFSPKSHLAFAPRNLYDIASILARVNEDKRKNVTVYKYGQPHDNAPKKTTLHKKVIVIDENVVIAGSSNLGYKSTVTASDHEINFIMRSKEFAKNTIEVIKDDAYQINREVEMNHSKSLVTLSQKVLEPLKHYNYSSQCRAWFHRRAAWLVG